jgi:hypothetical protein
MKEFFFTQTENHLHAQDLNIAKFWKDLTPIEKEKTWAKVSKAQESVIADLKKTEVYKKYDPE